MRIKVQYGELEEHVADYSPIADIRCIHPDDDDGPLGKWCYRESEAKELPLEPDRIIFCFRPGALCGEGVKVELSATENTGSSS